MMSDYRIEAHIAPPTGRSKRTAHKYPLDSMTIGQSFFVPMEDDDTPEMLINRMRNAAFRAKCKGHGSFVVRFWELGVRVWRVK